jgi:hypothetical protein
MRALVLSEDSSSQAYDTVRALVKHLLLCVDANTCTHRIEFEPSEDPDARAAVHGNRWREGKGPHYTRLLSVIAGKLVEEDGFVFFHFDGDTAWRDRDECLTRKQFEAEITAKIPDLIRMRLASRNSEAQRKRRRSLSDAEIERVVTEAMPRLHLIVPHYSVESWCYQNTSKARELCDQHHRGAHTRVFISWAATRAELDEVEMPKEKCCLGSNFNADLASASYPRHDVLAVDKSFAQAVTECSREPLRATLARTYDPTGG